mmetsp:Transcript_32332/g.63191  ORF Transcript_32332/g.63191 Transcript_32332/m.63191 type:complete len:219 (-) Transcript_32332:484-1140(-)
MTLRRAQASKLSMITPTPHSTSPFRNPKAPRVGLVPNVTRRGRIAWCQTKAWRRRIQHRRPELSLPLALLECSHGACKVSSQVFLLALLESKLVRQVEQLAPDRVLLFDRMVQLVVNARCALLEELDPHLVGFLFIVKIVQLLLGTPLLLRKSAHGTRMLMLQFGHLPLQLLHITPRRTQLLHNPLQLCLVQRGGLLKACNLPHHVLRQLVQPLGSRV